jgi:hypothetical protein
VPLAASSSQTGLIVFSMVVLVAGYVGIWALWHFVFRHGGDHEPPYIVDDEDDRDRSDG